MNLQLATAAQRAGVRRSSIRVAAASNGTNWNAQLLEGRDASGSSTFAISSAIFQAPFVRLTTLTQGGTNALVVFPVFGGSQLGSTSRATILGLARDDVARLVAVFPDGTQRDVPLLFHAFAYSANEIRSIPTTLNAYDAGGNLVQARTLNIP
jgi:hypothetical protein